MSYSYINVLLLCSHVLLLYSDTSYYLYSHGLYLYRSVRNSRDKFNNLIIKMTGAIKSLDDKEQIVLEVNAQASTFLKAFVGITLLLGINYCHE